MITLPGKQVLLGEGLVTDSTSPVTPDKA
jgi:hypothetical protein